jgi:hypothetical protein
MRTDRKNRNQITRMLLVLCLMTAFGHLQLLAQTAASVFSFFPRLIIGQNAGSGIIIFNPTADQVSAILTAKKADGSFLSNSTVSIPPFGQISKTAGELFPGVSLSQGALAIASATNGLVASYSTYGKSFADGIEGAASDTELIFPIIARPSEGTSEIDLHNPNVRPTVAELKLWGLAGNLLRSSAVYIPAGGVYQARPEGIFGMGTDFSQASHVTVTSRAINIFSQAQSILGITVLSGFSPFSLSGADIAVVSAKPLSAVTNAGVIPYFRTGLKYASTLCLASIEPAGVDVTLTLVGNSGATLDSQRVTLAARGGFRAPIQNLFTSLGDGEYEGWILIQSSGRVSANILFGRSDAGAFATVPMQSLPMGDIIFPFAYQGFGSSMELSLVNSGASPSDVGIYLVQPSGVTLATNLITIAPGARVSQSLHQLLPEVQNLAGGYVYISAPQPIFSTASLWSDDGTTVSSFTPQRLTTAFRAPELTNFSVTGKLTLNGSPVGGFQVVLSGPLEETTVSDADGLYAFTGLRPGNYSMAVDQMGFEFVPAQVNFEITNANIHQDFQGYGAPDAIVVLPGSVAVNSPDTSIDVFGNGFSKSSQVLANFVQLSTTFINSGHLKAVIPAYLLKTPAQLSVCVATGDFVSRSFAFMAFQSKPTLTSVTLPGNIFEGNSGTTLTLNGTGFLPGLIVKVNNSSEGIQVTVVDSTKALASLPGSYFINGGIYPVTVQNSNPSSIESNLQLLTVYYRSPEVQRISPNRVTVRLEPGQGSVPIEIFGFGFKRGAVALLSNDTLGDQVLSTSYCEDSAYCLATHLYASIPASLLRESGYAGIAVRNPSPTLGSSGIQELEIRGLEPTIVSIIPGSAAVRDSGGFTMPVVVNGTNFGPQSSVQLTGPDGESSESEVTLLSSTQLVVTVDITYPEALGTWFVQVSNPGPGGGTSSPKTFVLLAENFDGNPFLISMNPTEVTAGGPRFTLTIDGTNFKPGAQLQFYTTLLPVTVVSSEEVTVTIPAYLIETAGKYPISLINPDTGGNSNRLYLDVR